MDNTPSKPVETEVTHAVEYRTVDGATDIQGQTRRPLERKIDPALATGIGEK
jgi:hypothetical protein